MRQKTFIDVSALVEGTPGSGHLFSFHSNLVMAADHFFNKSFVFGPILEESDLVFPVFSRKFFDRGLGNFYQKIGMKEDLARANAKLESISGPKVLHFYEGGLRDLTFLVELLSQRRDVVAVFNFFSVEPWSQLLTSRFPGSRGVRKRLGSLISELSENVVFTCDSTRMQSLFARHIGVKEVSIYPLFSSVRSPGETDQGWSERKYSYLFAPRTWTEQRLVIKTLEILGSTATQTHNVAIAPRWKSKFSPRKIRNLLSSSVTAEVVKGPLSQYEYGELFHQSKVVVLPYLDKHYIFGSSGKVLDSRMANSLTVAPINTSAGQLVKEKEWGKAIDISPKNLALVLSEIDLNERPIFEGEDPSVDQCLQEIVELSRNLKCSSTELSSISFLYAIPFLLGLKGTRWALTHLVAGPFLRVANERSRKASK